MGVFFNVYCIPKSPGVASWETLLRGLVEQGLAAGPFTLRKATERYPDLPPVLRPPDHVSDLEAWRPSPSVAIARRTSPVTCAHRISRRARRGRAW